MYKAEFVDGDLENAFSRPRVFTYESGEDEKSVTTWLHGELKRRYKECHKDSSELAKKMIVRLQENSQTHAVAPLSNKDKLNLTPKRQDGTESQPHFATEHFPAVVHVQRNCTFSLEKFAAPFKGVGQFLTVVDGVVAVMVLAPDVLGGESTGDVKTFLKGAKTV